jgi:hypothetical protein
MNKSLCLVLLSILLYFVLTKTGLMEHAAGSPGTMIQLATSTTQHPNRQFQSYHNSRGYVFPTFIHNDWDPYTQGVERGHRHNSPGGSDSMAHTRDIGYSYGGNSTMYVLVIVALMGYIVYKK